MTPSLVRRSVALVVAVGLLASGLTPVQPADPAGAVFVSRLSGGTDRYSSAAAMSRATFSPGVPTAFVATGLTFPDALAGGPAAARIGAPVLLVTTHTIPAATGTELARLAPAKIVILGGPLSVSPQVATDLAAFTSGTVSRMAGTDRYQAAAAISATYFPPGTAVAYVATGENFPDALAAGPAAALLGGPVLLTKAGSLPATTRAEMQRLAPKRIIVVGGSLSVSDSVLNALKAYTSGTVVRHAGANRYAGAAAISAATFKPADVSTVYVASGLTFPDALAGVPVAAKGRAPILLARTSSLPDETRAELRRLAPSRVILLGGPNTLTPSVSSAISTALAYTPNVSVGPFTFVADPFGLEKPPIDQLAYYGNTLLAIYGNRDATGAFIFQHTDGKWYDHPVGQAQYIVNMLRNYRLKPDPTYLQLAIANGNRLLARAHSHGGGIFFPYDMDYVLHGRGTMRAPWYSGMAQGIALSGFVRLYEWTADAKWLDAAHRTFASFKVPRQSGKPWVVAVDNGLLWFEEYPWIPFDHTFNGHNFAVYGLYDYWRLTASDEARRLIQGGLTTASRVAGTVRVPGGISHYCIAQSCLDRKVRNRHYHVTHTVQFVQLFRYARHDRFAQLADVFISDNPDFRIPGTVLFRPGTHTAYRYDTSGSATAVTSVTIASGSSAPFSERNVPYGWIKPGNGISMLVSAGTFAGLWVRESSIVRPRGFVDRLRYFWSRTLAIPPGSYTAHQYDANGTVIGTLNGAVAATSWGYTEKARINGDPAVLLSTGPLAGYWLRLTSAGAPAATSVTAADDAWSMPEPSRIPTDELAEDHPFADPESLLAELDAFLGRLGMAPLAVELESDAGVLSSHDVEGRSVRVELSDDGTRIERMSVVDPDARSAELDRGDSLWFGVLELVDPEIVAPDAIVDSIMPALGRQGSPLSLSERIGELEVEAIGLGPGDELLLALTPAAR